jgi:hypothetical protein
MGRTRTEHLPDGVCCCGWTEVDSLVLEYHVGTLENDSACLAESLMAITSACFPGTLRAAGWVYLAGMLMPLDFLISVCYVRTHEHPSRIGFCTDY